MFCLSTGSVVARHSGVAMSGLQTLAFTTQLRFRLNGYVTAICLGTRAWKGPIASRASQLVDCLYTGSDMRWKEVALISVSLTFLWEQ